MGGAAAFSELVRCPGPAFSGIASSGTGTRPCSPTSGPADRAGRPGHFLKIYRPEGALCRPDLPWRWPFLDIFLYDLTGGEVRTRFESRTIFLPASHVLPPRPVLFAGSHRLAPACLLPVLRILYGDYETYRIKTYDHRRERPITLDDVVERVNAADRRHASGDDDHSPSPFAPVAAAYFARTAGGRILDLGRGEGRATRFFRARGMEVDQYDPYTGPDQEELTAELSRYRRVYCRGLLHVLSARQRESLLKHLRGVVPGTVVCLEFRDPADAAGLTPVANDPRLFFDDGHFRWLVSADEVAAELGPGFEVLHHALGRFCPTTTSNPVLARMIVRRTSADLTKPFTLLAN